MVKSKLSSSSNQLDQIASILDERSFRDMVSKVKKKKFKHFKKQFKIFKFWAKRMLGSSAVRYGGRCRNFSSSYNTKIARTKPWKAAYVNHQEDLQMEDMVISDRLQHCYQFQVLIKPSLKI